LTNQSITSATGVIGDVSSPNEQLGTPIELKLSI
jgi:hypothetical protein